MLVLMAATYGEDGKVDAPVILDENGKINAGKLNVIMFDQFQNSYYTVGSQLAQAWKVGSELMKK